MTSRYTKKRPDGLHNYIRNVAVIGGAGHVGKYLLKAVHDKDNFSVTAIQRPNSTSTLPDGVKVVKAEYGGDSDDSQLVEALRGQEALIVTMAVTAPRDTTLRISRAAAAAGVSFVLPNWYGHDDAANDLCKDSLLLPASEGLKAEFKTFTDTAYIFLVCNFWYEFSLGGGPDRYGFDFQKRTFTWFDNGDVKINSSTWPQCGRAIASALSLKIFPDDEADSSPSLSQFRNKSIYISSFLVSQRDMFESVKRVTNTTDVDWTISHESAEQRWKDGMAEVHKGNFGAFTKMLYSRMFFPTGDSNYESRRGLDNQLLGLPVEDLDEWTKIAVRMGENGEVATSH
ncbi:hypothetical protein MBLNU459_g0805t1 [Dothideomycetes sp. NU459]